MGGGKNLGSTTKNFTSASLDLQQNNRNAPGQTPNFRVCYSPERNFTKANSIKYLHIFRAYKMCLQLHCRLSSMILFLIKYTYYIQSKFVSLGRTKAMRQSDGSCAIESKEHVSIEWGRMNSNLAHMDFEAGILITPAQSLCFKYDMKSWNWSTDIGSTRGMDCVTGHKHEIPILIHKYVSANSNSNKLEWIIMIRGF